MSYTPPKPVADGKAWASEVRWRDPDTERHRSTTVRAKTEKACREKAIALNAKYKQAKAEGGELPAPRRSETIHDVAREQWAKKLDTQLAQRTANNYRWVYKTHIGPLLGHRKIAKVANSHQVLDTWMDALVDEGVPESTREMARAALGSLMSCARDERIIRSHVGPDIARQYRGAPKEVSVISPIAWELVLLELRAGDGKRKDDACELDWLLGRLIGEIGQRPEEACALVFGDFHTSEDNDEEAARLLGDVAHDEEVGEDETPRKVSAVVNITKAIQPDAKLGTTKTKASRSTPTPVDLVHAIRARMERLGLTPQDHLFTVKPRGGGDIHVWGESNYKNWQRRWWTPARDRAAEKYDLSPLAAGATPYDGRHLWISMRIAAGHPAGTVGFWAGTSEQMIRKTYGHVITQYHDATPVDFYEQVNRARTQAAKIASGESPRRPTLRAVA